MRRLRVVIFALCLVMLQTGGRGVATATDTGNEKDLCLLYSQNCPNQSLTYQEKIARFKEEINKGAQVYTQAELQRLEAKLQDTEKMFDNLLYGPGSLHGRGHRR